MGHESGLRKTVITFMFGPDAPDAGTYINQKSMSCQGLSAQIHRKRSPEADQQGPVQRFFARVCR